MSSVNRKNNYGQGKTFFTLVEDYAKNPYGSFTVEQVPLGSRIFYKKTADATVGDLYITEDHDGTKVSVLYGRGAATTSAGDTPEELAKFPEGSKTETAVGGLPANTDIGNKSVYDVLDMMLLPEYLPYRSGGTVTVTISGAEIREVGSNTPTEASVSVSESKRKIIGKANVYVAEAGAQTSTDNPSIASTCGVDSFDAKTTQEGDFTVSVSRTYGDGTNLVFGSAAFDTGENYAVGDYVYKMGDGGKEYYRFVKAHVAGEWKDDDVEVVPPSDEAYKANRARTNKGDISEKYSTATNTPKTSTSSNVVAETASGSWIDANEFVKGYTASNNDTVKYRYPYFGTTVNGELTKQSLVDIDAQTGKTVEMTLKSGYLQKFAVPQTWGEIGIQQFINNTWSVTNAYKKSTIEQTIQGSSVAYNLYTIDTMQSDDVKVRITKK